MTIGLYGRKNNDISNHQHQDEYQPNFNAKWQQQLDKRIIGLGVGRNYKIVSAHIVGSGGGIDVEKRGGFIVKATKDKICSFVEELEGKAM